MSKSVHNEIPCLTAVFFDSPTPRWEQLQRQYFTDGLGLPGKLAEYSSKSNSPPVPGIISVVFVVRDQGDCGKRIELHPSNHYQMSSVTSCIPPITTRWPVQLVPSLLLLPDVQCDQVWASARFCDNVT